MRQIRKYINAGTIIAHDDLLINPQTPPLRPIRERIVVPEQVIHGLLTMLHLRLDHPKPYQMNKAFSRYFYSLHSEQDIADVYKACPQCASLEDLPEAMIPQSTESPPSTVGSRFAADVIKRFSQKIFCIRETVTSYTMADLIPDETKETIADIIVKQCNLLRPSSSSQITIRLDPHPSNQSLYKSLTSNNLLRKNNIHLEIGRIINKNKNPVIDKGIRELIREMLILQPAGGKISPNILSQAVANLNCRYRSSGLSSQEMWTQRDQITGKQLPIADRDLIVHKHLTRLKNHPHSEKSKSHGKPPRPTPDVKVGSLVFVHTDRDKLSARQRYIVTAIKGNDVKLRKFTEKLFGVTEYDAKLQEIYKVPSLDRASLPGFTQDDSSSDDEMYTNDAETETPDPQKEETRVAQEQNTPVNSSSETQSLSSDDIQASDATHTDESDEGNNESDEEDPTLVMPRNITPATMVREPRIRRRVNRWSPQ